MVFPGSGTWRGRSPRGRDRSREVQMRAMLWIVGVVAGVLILLGLVLEAVRWLIIIGLIALVVAIVLGVVKGRQALRR
jgi:apolipoprotein N-acyltransferase